jgi:hypothetical protein
VIVNVPDESPTLTERGWRALLEVLVADAEREHLRDKSGDEYE